MRPFLFFAYIWVLFVVRRLHIGVHMTGMRS
jgi:hypothetical protein